MSDGCYRFNAYGASVRVDAPEEVTVPRLARYIASEVAIEECGDGPSDLHLTRWKGRYHLINGERRYGPYGSMNRALLGVSNGIYHFLGKRSPLTFLHACAVEIDGTAIVFPSRNRWEKSNLVSSLVKQGCGYLSDHYAVISDKGLVFPLSKSAGPSETVRPDAHFNHNEADGIRGFRCGAIVLTKYKLGARWSSEPLTHGFAVLATLPCALGSRQEPEQTLRTITELARHAHCCHGIRGEGEPTLDALRELLEVESFAEEASA